MPSARDCLEELHALLHAILDPAKAIPPRAERSGTIAGIILGVEARLPESAADICNHILVRASLPASKVSKYYFSLCTRLEKNITTAGEASKLVGQLEFTASFAWDRSARPFLWPLRERSNGSTGARANTPALSFSYRVLRAFLLRKPPRVLRSSALVRQHFVGFSDARGRTSTSTFETIGVLLCGAGSVWFSYLDLKHSAAERFLGCGQQRINEAEALGAAMLVYTFAYKLRGSSLSLWIDSTAAEGTLRKGYSRSPLLASITGAFWLTAERNEIAVWVGRVPSKLNPADSVSRSDFSFVQSLCASRVAPHVPDPTDWSFLLDDQ